MMFMLPTHLLASLLIAAPAEVSYSGPENPGAATDLSAFQPPTWEANAQAFIAVHETNLRSSAAADGASIELLPIASRVTIRGPASEPVKVGQRVDRWYKIVSAAGTEGYVFGGALTSAAFEQDFDDDGTPEKVTVTWSPDYKARVRYFDDGIVKELNLKPGGQAYVCCGGTLTVEVISSKKAGLTLLQIKSTVEACGDYLVALVSFVGGEPRLAIEAGGLADAPSFAEPSFAFAPKKKQLTVVTKVTNSDEENAKPEIIREIYRLEKGVFAKAVNRAPTPDTRHPSTDVRN